MVAIGELQVLPYSNFIHFSLFDNRHVIQIATTHRRPLDLRSYKKNPVFVLDHARSSGQERLESYLCLHLVVEFGMSFYCEVHCAA